MPVISVAEQFERLGQVHNDQIRAAVLTAALHATTLVT
jgi:hypothetical protein